MVGRFPDGVPGHRFRPLAFGRSGTVKLLSGERKDPVGVALAKLG